MALDALTPRTSRRARRLMAAASYLGTTKAYDAAAPLRLTCSVLQNAYSVQNQAGAKAASLTAVAIQRLESA